MIYDLKLYYQVGEDDSNEYVKLSAYSKQIKMNYFKMQRI